MRHSRRLPATVLVLALALAAPLASTAPVSALGEALADWSTGILTTDEPDFGPRHRYASRSLGRGDRGTDVASLQRFLTDAGVTTDVSGVYRPGTTAGVRRWEASHGIEPDGSVTRSEARRIRAHAGRWPGWGLDRLGGPR